MKLSLFGALTIAGIYCGLGAAHTFGLVGIETFGACAAICGLLYGVAEWTA